MPDFYFYEIFHALALKNRAYALTISKYDGILIGQRGFGPRPILRENNGGVYI
jgi:hypothetical protein